MQTKEEKREYQKKWRENNKEEKQEIIKICKCCKKEFIAKRKNKIFCSGKCKSKEYRENNREEANEYAKEYRENNREKANEYAKEWRENNREEANEYAREYREKNKEEISIKHKEWRENNKEEINKRQNNRKKSDINYKLACNLRSRLRSAIKNNYKSGSAVRDLGCSIPRLRIYLESKFQSGMTWDNWGLWHIDHIIPLSSFNLENREELLKAVNYINLQPLWAKDNFSKGDKII